jgi:hypothetical protein
VVHFSRASKQGASRPIVARERHLTWPTSAWRGRLRGTDRPRRVPVSGNGGGGDDEHPSAPSRQDGHGSGLGPVSNRRTVYMASTRTNGHSRGCLRSARFNGGPSRTRTVDPLIKSRTGEPPHCRAVGTKLEPASRTTQITAHEGARRTARRLREVPYEKDRQHRGHMNLVPPLPLPPRRP